MSAKTGIQWTDRTWNPIRGCSRVSEGCRNCYAEQIAARFSGPGLAYEGLARRRSNGEAQWTGEVRVIEHAIREPLSWRTPARVFVNSMSDLFHENVSDETIARIFQTMAEAERHTFQVLTKRPERMLYWFAEYLPEACSGEKPAPVWPLPNVWLGVSCENQATADERLPLLMRTPAAIRFASFEPLLSPIDLGAHHGEPFSDEPMLDWAIVGGESGKHARPFDLGWCLDLLAQCEFAGIAAFVKQLGRRPVCRNDYGSILWPGETIPFEESYEPHHQGEVGPLALGDSHGGDMDEWPEDLRVREFPAAVTT